MNVNIEFLGNEPLDNVVTSLNFKFDKVVFFGYNDGVQDLKDRTSGFLKKHCGVEHVTFFQISKTNLASALKEMRRVLSEEYKQGNRVYFDITGGESLILIAFGMLAEEFDTPLHMYDIPSGKLIELNDGVCKRRISRDVPKRKTKLTLDRFIELHGAVINKNLQKGYKNLKNTEFKEDIESLWQISNSRNKIWNDFSTFLHGFVPDKKLLVTATAGRVIEAVKAKPNLKNVKTLNNILDACEKAGLLLGVQHSDGKYSFRYKNDDIKSCMWDAGSILELHTFYSLMNKVDDCAVGVHIDWDGVIHKDSPKDDVTNEIDVLTIKGYVPTFISCKNGKVTKEALYELDTVTKRFGGKYAKMVLVAPCGLENMDRLRAQEMDIKIIKTAEEFDEQQI